MEAKSINVLQMKTTVCQQLLDCISPPDINGARKFIVRGTPGQLALRDYIAFAMTHPNSAERRAYIGEMKLRDAFAMMAAVDAMQ